MKVIDLTKWGKYTGREPLCSLPLSVNEFRQRTGIELEEFEEANKGVCYCAFVQLGQLKYFIQGFVSRESKQPPIAVDMEGNNADPAASLFSLLEYFDLDAADLPWCRRDLTPPQWVLVRETDNGSRLEISRYYNEKAALWVMTQFDSQTQKQGYSVVKARC